MDINGPQGRENWQKIREGMEGKLKPPPP